MSAAALDYRPGDQVKLLPREAPFWDDLDAWWTVISVSDLGLNVECGGKCRAGVSPALVRDVRRK
jgi:hypothetical protein